jgi:hypothetical protein
MGTDTAPGLLLPGRTDDELRHLVTVAAFS